MLSHLRVLDLSDGGSGLAGQILSDLGADVLLIEPPGGVPSRELGPFCDGTVAPNRSLEFWSVHRGKRSVVLDLERAAGRDELLDLVATADVWIDDWRPGRAAELGLDAPTLARARPELIHISITPFGEQAPKRDWAATDLTVTASTMALWLTGDEDRPPLSCSAPQAFMHAGAEAACGALIALRERSRSGLGQHVDVSAQAAMMISTQSTLLSHAWNDAQLGRVAGGVKLLGHRIRFIYPCADGYANLTFLFGQPLGLGVARFVDWMFEEGCCDVDLKNEDWVAYGAKLLGGHISPEQHEASMQTIGRFMRTKTKAELRRAAFERRLLLVPLSDMQDLHRSEQLIAREFWQTLHHPDLARDVAYPGPFAKLSRTPIRYRHPPPSLGAHSAQVMAEARERRAPEPRQSTESALPLAGLRVLDFSWVYAGPAVTRVLGDYGATVIRLESQSAPDALRAGQPFKDGQAGWERSGNYANVNVGKLNLGLNLRTPEARRVAMRLVDWADVVVENFSPRAMVGFGLDYETLKQRKPELIMLSSSLAGQTGPERALAGYGTMGAALAGFGYVTGWPDRAPAAPFMAYTDYVSPRFALAALLAALEHRERSGEGQHIDCAQAEASIHNLGALVLEPSVGAPASGPRGNACLHYAPSGVYPVVGDDRWVALAAPDQRAWLALAELAGQNWERDARFVAPADRLAHRESLDQAIADWTRDCEVEWLEETLQERQVPVHRVSLSEDLFADPQLNAREHFVTLDHAELGPLPYESSRIRLSRTPAQLQRGTATLGQHSAFVLSEILGLSEGEITELVIAGAIE